MIRKLLISALWAMSLSSTALSNEARAQDHSSEQYCRNLAQIGASTWRTRTNGYPVEKVLNEVKAILRSNPQTLEDAQDAIVAIYNDRSVNSSQQAYSKVYDGCRH